VDGLRLGLAFGDALSGCKGKEEAQMESPGTSDIELAWVQQLEDCVQEVLRSRASRDINALQEERTTFGEHAADVLAAKAGSWTFILSFLAVLGLWIAINTVLLIRHWDPYPFILLNLVLSCLAAIQAPVIMMSQNRQDKKDRLRSELDFDVNRRTHVEIQGLAHRINLLHDKIDDVEEMVRKPKAT
jgi:uncharacterized membrane protein